MGEPGEDRRFWFGPKRGFGWGWSPVTWEGWLATLVALVAFVVVSVTTHGAVRIGTSLGIAAALAGLSLLTGTAPGFGGRSLGSRGPPLRDEMPDLYEATRRLDERHRQDLPDRPV